MVGNGLGQGVCLSPPVCGAETAARETMFPEVSEIWRKETIGRILLFTKKP